MMAHIQVYQERRKIIGPVQYRWRIVASNGRVIAMASEGYHNLADLWHAVNETAKALGVAAARDTIPIHARKPPRV